MKEKEEVKNAFMVEKLQKALKKLISEEWIAGNFYSQMMMACKPEEERCIHDLFKKTSNDEINDHMKSLVEWCLSYKYEFPCKYAEFKKLAGKEDVKAFEDFKEGEGAGYYIDEAIKSEERAIKSYEDALKIEEVPQFTDLQTILWNNYYDEKDHLEQLHSAKIAYEANVSMDLL